MISMFLKILTIVLICCLLISLFRLFAGLVEHFMDLYTTISSSKDRIEPQPDVEHAVHIHKKAA